jgi:hypothetical protein
VRLRVDPSRLAETAASLRFAVDVAREVEGSRASLRAHLARPGSEPLRRATEDFLDAWCRGLGGVADRAETLARLLDLAASSYADVEERVRRSGREAP